MKCSLRLYLKMGWKVEASFVPGDAVSLEHWRNLGVTRLFPLLYLSFSQKLHSPLIPTPLAVPALGDWVVRSSELYYLQQDFV